MIVLQDLRIDPEFEKIIPPLEDDEFKQLETNILQDGEIYTPLFAWDGLIIDGHHRYKILQKHPEIKYRIVEKQFNNRFAVLAWICNNQLGRRNLTPEQRKYLIGKRYKSEKMAVGSVSFQGNQYAKVVCGHNDHTPKSEDYKRTRQKIADETNTTDSFVRRAEYYVDGIETAEKMIPGIKSEILSGKIKPTDKDISAIAKAPEEDRLAMAEALRLPKPKPKRNDSPPEEPETVSTFSDTSAKIDASLAPRADESDIIHTLDGAADEFISTCEVQFGYFPKLLTDSGYLKQIQIIMEKPHTYIEQKIKEMKA